MAVSPPCFTFRGCIAFVCAALLPDVGSADLFRDRVAPLLESRCLSCHDATKKRGGLDLSSRAGLFAGGDNGAVVVARQPAKSRLIQLVSGPSPRMPRSGPKLTPGEIATLRRWVEDGVPWAEGVSLRARTEAEDEAWWSLRPLVRPAIQPIEDRSWGRNAIDAFILAALEQRRLRPSPRADRRILIRRLTFDLHGLPPTPEEVEAYLADARPDAYERVVERLLSSPAYGERWGRHWLDVARYGDTHGYDKDKRRDQAWPYRDWVVRAFNADLPYRDFVKQQLAGDVMRPGDADGIIATGFVVAGPWDFVGHVELREGTVDKEKTRLLDRDDMVTNAAGAFLSLTVGCARCHDHKFDPIPQRDYYRLQAVFAGVERGPRPLDATVRLARQKLLDERQRLQKAATVLTREIAAATGPSLGKLDERLKGLRDKLAEIRLPAGAPSPSNGWHSGILARPDAIRWVQIDLGAALPLDEVRLFPARPTDFRDAPGFGFPLRFKIEASAEPTFAKPLLVADHTSEDFPSPRDTAYIASLKGQKARHVRVTATRLWKRLEDYVFALAEVQVVSDGKNVAAGKTVSSFDSIEAGRWGRRFLVDDCSSRHRLPDLTDAGVAKQFREQVRLTVEIREVERHRTHEAARLVPAALTAQQAKLDARLRKVEGELRRPAAGPAAYAVMPIPPRPIHVLHRGDVEQRKAEATPGGPGCVNGLSPEFTLRGKTEGERRLALAEWIADGRNGLTWRSIANRVWHYHFGKGLVDTPSDFGKMGGLPSHPDLLDWLADEVRQADSLKHLHRLIVTSATYLQASRHDDAAAKVDADNRYLWRMNRLRLDAESIRDAILAVSGRLDRRMGGPGFELFRFKDDHSPIYDHLAPERIHDPATYRRTVYRFTPRSVPNPLLDCLDSADPNQPTPVRNSTLTALQALALMNNPFVARQSSHFADRVRTHSPDLDRQVEQAYRLAFGRSPTSEERDEVGAHARKHGLAAACRVLLNANEFIFVD